MPLSEFGASFLGTFSGFEVLHDSFRDFLGSPGSPKSKRLYRALGAGLGIGSVGE